METRKFSGWTQLINVSLIVGLTSLAGAGFFQISNTLMFRDQQVVMTATVYGLAFSLFSLMQGPPQPLVAQFVKKIGARNTSIIGCVLLIILGFGLSQFVNSGTSFVIIYGIFWGLGSVLTSQIASQTLINSWFHHRRGQAMSLSRSLSFFFSIICPYIATFMITKLGGSFRIGWHLTGVTSAIALVLCFFIKNTPQEYGQVPDGILEGEEIDIKKKRGIVSTVYKRPMDLGKTTIKEALKTPIFWAMFITSALGFVLHMVFNASFSVHYANLGYNLEIISLASALRLIVSLILLLLFSTILDRIEPAYVYGLAFISFAGACFIAATVGNSGTWVIYTAFVLTAMVNSCLMTVIPTVIANYYGIESFATLQGFTLLIGGLVSSTSGIITGALADLTGDYTFGYIIYGVVALVGAAIAIFGVGIPCARRYKGEIAKANSKTI